MKNTKNVTIFTGTYFISDEAVSAINEKSVTASGIITETFYVSPGGFISTDSAVADEVAAHTEVYAVTGVTVERATRDDIGYYTDQARDIYRQAMDYIKDFGLC
ncbi:MAG: hypothetical protein IKF39_04235 [Oscillospiraceae bacterium]|nr:hypothetical protein [Oscillospiraceae bacterium]